MTKELQQDLFNYLSKELNCIATQTQMLEIEAIVMCKHEKQIKDAYKQGFREGIIHPSLPKDFKNDKNAQDYYNKTFKK